MKKRIMAYLSAALVWAMLAAVLSGCTLLKFDDPADVKKDQEVQVTPDTKAEPIDPASILDSEKLTMDEQLTDASGKVVAVYKAALPYFSNEAGDAAVDSINQYYEEEFSQLKDDKDRFFGIVGEKPAESGEPRSSIISYELLDAPQGYVSVLRCYEGLDTLGAQQENYFCEVFSASTGWKLRFSDIFGENRDKAMTCLREEIEQWCFENDYDAKWLYNADDATISDNFAFDGSTAYIGIPAYTAPGGETLIKIPFDQLAQYVK